MTDAVEPVTDAAVPVTQAAGTVTQAAAPVVTAAEPVAKAVDPVVQAAAPVVEQAARAAAPVVQAAAPVVRTVAETVAPVVQTAVATAAPVVRSVSETIAPVVSQVAETVAPVVQDVATPVAAAATPVTVTVGKTLHGLARRAHRLECDRARVGAGRRPHAPVRSRHGGRCRDGEVSRDNPTQASGASVQAGSGGFRSARTPLAGVRVLTTPAPRPDRIAPVVHSSPPDAPSVVRSTPEAAPAGSDRNVTPASPPIHGPRPLGLALLGGLLAVGAALVSTSSATGGGHAPSSTTAATTPRYRLVAPALRWRLCALADRVRPEPVVFPLELPG